MSDSPADWDRVKQVFQAALDRPRDERTRYLQESCDDDRALLREVESLLLASDSYVSTTPPVHVPQYLKRFAVVSLPRCCKAMPSALHNRTT